MRFRVSIRAIMGLVLLAALGVAALRFADDLWASITFSATLLILGVATLGAAFRRGVARASYAGAAAFGIGYLVLCFGPWTQAEVRPRLLTTRMLQVAYRAIHGDADPDVRVWDTWSGKPTSSVAFSPQGDTIAFTARGDSLGHWRRIGAGGPGPNRKDFEAVGHSLAALVAALLGGLIARHFAARTEREAATPETPGCR